MRSVADEADDQRAEEGGSHHIEPVTGDIDGEGRIRHKALDGVVGQALQQRVGTGDDQVGGEAGLCARVASDHADDRVFADARVNDSSHRRNDDHRSIGSDVAVGADEGDQVRNDGGRNILQGVAEHRQNQSGFLTHTDGAVRRW